MDNDDGFYVINITWPQIELRGCQSILYKGSTTICSLFTLHSQCLHNLNWLTHIEYGNKYCFAAFEWE